jgi:predicted NACHT family NTPase
MVERSRRASPEGKKAAKTALAVLESIEAQHGLLEEQTMGSYSFSHLTFHEYFTANKIVTSVGANGCLPLEALVTHITEPRWR